MFEAVSVYRQRISWLDIVILRQDLIEDIVATAQRAPSSFNSQPYKVKSQIW